MFAARQLDRFDEALSLLAAPAIATETMCKVIDFMPIPVVVFDIDETISWANRCMLNLTFGVPEHLIFFKGQECFGKRIVDVFPETLAQYVIPRNRKVWTDQAAQYESWQDQDKPGVQWDVIRYPVNSTKICAVLLPNDSDTVNLCQTIMKRN